MRTSTWSHGSRRSFKPGYRRLRLCCICPAHGIFGPQSIYVESHFVREASHDLCCQARRCVVCRSIRNSPPSIKAAFAVSRPTLASSIQKQWHLVDLSARGRFSYRFSRGNDQRSDWIVSPTKRRLMARVLTRNDRHRNERSKWPGSYCPCTYVAQFH